MILVPRALGAASIASIALAWSSVPAVSGEVTARVPGTGVEFSLVLPDYRPMKDEPGKGAKKFILLGHLGPVEKQVVVSVVAEKSPPKRTSAGWREDVLRGNATEKNPARFDCEGVACSECSTPMDGTPLVTLDYHAFPVAAGAAFDVHVLVLHTGDPKFTRADFEAIVRSFRVPDAAGSAGPGWPKGVVDVRELAAKQGPDPVPWLEDQCRIRPDDYAPHFVLGESALARKDLARVTSGFSRASELLLKKPKPTPQERFALGMSEEGLVWALCESSRHADALVHARKALDVAQELKTNVARGERAYVAARLCGRLSDTPGCAKHLREAIGVDPKYRESARQDADFDPVRGEAQIKKLL